MKKLYSNTYLMRFLTAQLPSLALFIIILSNQVFKASLLVQICFYLILVSNLVLNLYFMNKIKKESSSDILSNQIFFTILTLALFIFSSYRLITISDDFQKLIALISTILLFILLILLIWGIKYAKVASRKHKTN